MIERKYWLISKKYFFQIQIIVFDQITVRFLQHSFFAWWMTCLIIRFTKGFLKTIFKYNISKQLQKKMWRGEKAPHAQNLWNCFTIDDWTLRIYEWDLFLLEKQVIIPVIHFNIILQKINSIDTTLSRVWIKQNYRNKKQMFSEKKLVFCN
jgi:hypothetical protein